jgi:tetratricopeptide (TPR) repeat protein
LIFGIIVNLTSNTLEPKIKDYLSRNHPKVPYIAFLILSALIVVSIYIALKNTISRKIQILNFEIKNPDKNDSRRYIVNAIKRGNLKDESLQALLDSTKPSEIHPFIKLIRLKIGKRKSFALSEYFYDLGKYHQNKTHDLVTARDYFELATELYPEDPAYPNEAGVISSILGEHTKARDFFLTSMNVFSKKKKWRKGLATTQNNLGLCFLRLNQFDQALNYFKKSRITHSLITKDLTVYFIQNEINIASVYWKANLFSEAIQTLSDTNLSLQNVKLSTDTKSHRKEEILLEIASSHIPRLLSEIQLDIFQKSKNGKVLEESLNNAQTALSIDINNWGEHDEPTALSYYVLGKVFDEMNEKNNALKVYQKALLYLSKIQYKDHKPLVHCKKRIEEIEKV